MRALRVCLLSLTVWKSSLSLHMISDDQLIDGSDRRLTRSSEGFGAGDSGDRLTEEAEIDDVGQRLVTAWLVRSSLLARVSAASQEEQSRSNPS